MVASIVTVNFSNVMDIRQHSTGRPHDKLVKTKPRDANGKVLTPKQIRARARRRVKRNEVMSDQELEYLYRKPVDEWDLEELAHGRPRGANGRFSGPRPKWISAAVHEEAMDKYRAAVKSEMNATTVDALGLLKELINSDDVDDKGKPIVPASVKLDASKFLLEHVIGKPTQRIENDVSVKLQGILGAVMVNPADLNSRDQSQYSLGHFPGLTMELAESTGDYDDDEFLDRG